jgi:hypothetical protein
MVTSFVELYFDFIWMSSLELLVITWRRLYVWHILLVFHAEVYNEPADLRICMYHIIPCICRHATPSGSDDTLIL